MGLNPKMTSVFIRKGERHIQGEVAVLQREARILGIAGKHQTLEEVGKILPYCLWREHCLLTP